MPDDLQQQFKVHRHPPHTCPYCDAPSSGRTIGGVRTFICGTQALVNWPLMHASMEARGIDPEDAGDERSPMCEWVTRRALTESNDSRSDDPNPFRPYGRKDVQPDVVVPTGMLRDASVAAKPIDHRLQHGLPVHTRGDVLTCPNQPECGYEGMGDCTPTYCEGKANADQVRQERFVASEDDPEGVWLKGEVVSERMRQAYNVPVEREDGL